jgi:hypothetical protein
MTATQTIDPLYGWIPTKAALAVMAAARGKVGLVEGGGADGHSGNQIFVWDWWKQVTGEFDQGQPNCGAGLSWEFAQGGASKLVAAKNPHGFIYCPDGVNFFKAKKAFLPATAAHFCDPVFFDWEGAGAADHVGLVLYNRSHNGGNTLTTVEWNTSPEHSTGSQQNGGGVYIRNRFIDRTILGVGRPDWGSLTV